LNVSVRGFAGFPARIRCIQILTLSRSASRNCGSLRFLAMCAAWRLLWSMRTLCAALGCGAAGNAGLAAIDADEIEFADHGRDGAVSALSAQRTHVTVG
jgi:hypothetical protein